MGYRPSYPSWRAQDIQVLHAAHSLSTLGHPVTLLANRFNPDITSTDILSSYDLSKCDTFDFRLSPSTHLGMSGLWFRQSVIQWWMRHTGAVIVRDIERFSQLQRWLPKTQRIIIEAHQLPSIQAVDQGLPPEKWQKIEKKMLQQAWGIVSNCGGVMDLWRHQYPSRCPDKQLILHNGTSPSRACTSSQNDDIIRCLGSLRPEKGIHGLLPAISKSPVPIEFIGASQEEMAMLGDLPPHITVRQAVPYPDVPHLLATSKALLLPLQNNRFGRSLTSPLKLWDYLATDRPILAPDLQSVREIEARTNREMVFYNPDNPNDLLRHLKAPLPEKVNPFLRSWADRAEELSVFLSL